LAQVSPDRISPELEIVDVSLASGVDPHLALAVAHVETGGVPPRSRDRAVFKGNYGRFQVSCRTWRKVLGLSDCRDLLDRHVGIRSGVAVLAMVQASWGRTVLDSPTWVAHWNEGHELAHGPRLRDDTRESVADGCRHPATSTRLAPPQSRSRS
jgi:hypothetical protein